MRVAELEALPSFALLGPGFGDGLPGCRRGRLRHGPSGPGPDGVLGTGDDVVFANTTTGSDGGYLFASVTPGTYMVRVTDTGGELTRYSPTSGPESMGGDTLEVEVSALKGTNLDKLLDIELETGDLNPPDKRLLNELVHGVLRNQSKLDWVLTGFYHGQYSKVAPNVRNALRVAHQAAEQRLVEAVVAGLASPAR